MSLILSVRDIFWTRFLWQLTTKTRKIPAAKHVSQRNKPTETWIVVEINYAKVWILRQRDWKDAQNDLPCAVQRTINREYDLYPLRVSNWWKPMIGNSIDQSIKLVNWYRMVSANRSPIDNHTKTVNWLLSIGSEASNRCHSRYLSDHLLFLGSPGDEIGKTNSDPVFSTQRLYSVARVLDYRPVARHCLSVS